MAKRRIRAKWRKRRCLRGSFVYKEHQSNLPWIHIVISWLQAIFRCQRTRTEWFYKFKGKSNYRTYRRELQALLTSEYAWVKLERIRFNKLKGLRKREHEQSLAAYTSEVIHRLKVNRRLTYKAKYWKSS